MTGSGNKDQGDYNTVNSRTQHDHDIAQAREKAGNIKVKPYQKPLA